MKKVKGVLVNVNTRTVEPYTLHYNNYKDLTSLLNCDILDVTRRKFGSQIYDIYCDDEGLLKEVWIPSAFSEEYPENDFLVGNLFICSHDKYGDIASLSDEQIEEVLKTSRQIKVTDDNGSFITRALMYNYKTVDA